MRKPKFDRDLMPTTADTAVLLWGRPNGQLYSLATSLNEIYALRFVRDDDLVVPTGRGPVVCPCFTCSDDVRQLFYVLVGNPIFGGGLGGQMNYYHAILMITGDYAWDCQQAIYADICGQLSPAPVYDWIGCRRFEALKALRTTVSQIDYFDFRDESAPISSVYSNFSERAALKINTWFRELDTCLKSVMWAIGDTPGNN